MNASSVCLLCPLSLLGVTMWPRSCAKSLTVGFAENFYRENRLLGKIFVSAFVVLYLTHNLQLLETRCSETAFANQRMASVYFQEEKTFFLISFLFEFRIVALNLRCYLMVVFCVISPYSTTCSPVLKRHLISDVVKRFITFVSLALNSLAPKFCSHKTCQNAFVFIPLRDIPLRFIHRNLTLSEPIAWINAISG